LSAPCQPLIAVIGPTGAGKSELAVKLAQCFDGEIVNFDSIQVYRELNIGSAKPSASERSGIPHHLMDILQVNEELTAGAFASLARGALRDISSRHRVPILAGGTGFYLRALLDGLSPAPLRDKNLRSKLARRAPAALHRFLRRYDPATAARIHPRDTQKLIRAVEMTVLAGRPASQTQAAPRQALQGYSAIKIGLAPDRAALCARLNERAVRMFEGGLLEETASLLAKGVSPEAKPLQSLGYKQAVAHLTGDMDLADAIEQCQTKTRQYAKRQMTWFRAEKDVFWISGFGGDPGLQQQAIAQIEPALTRDSAC
jgi:tRNA dimethylallyltransferase